MLFTALAMVRMLFYSQDTIDRLDEITFAQWAERFAPHGSFKHMEPGINGLTFTQSSFTIDRVSNSTTCYPFSKILIRRIR
jgi:hypothetical protein